MPVGDDVELMPVQLKNFSVFFVLLVLLVPFFSFTVNPLQWTIRDTSTRVIEDLGLLKHQSLFAASPSTVAATLQVVVPMETTSTFFHNFTKHGPTRVTFLSFDAASLVEQCAYTPIAVH